MPLYHSSRSSGPITVSMVSSSNPRWFKSLATRPGLCAEAVRPAIVITCSARSRSLTLRYVARNVACTICSGQPVASSSSCRRARPIGMRASRRSAHRAAKATSSRYPNDVSRRIAARICEEAAPFAASNRSICADVRSLRARARTASCNHRSGDSAALSVTRLLTSLEQDRCLVCLVCLVLLVERN
jgi:hypothetical protein